MDSIQDLLNILREDPVYHEKRSFILLLPDTLKVLIFSERSSAVSAAITWRYRRFHYSYERVYTIFPGNNALCFCTHVQSTGTNPRRRASRRTEYSIKLTLIRDALSLYNVDVPDPVGFLEPPLNLFMSRAPTPDSFDHRVECLYVYDIPLREQPGPRRLQDFCARSIALAGLTADYIAENIGRVIVDPRMLALNDMQKLILDCRFLNRTNFCHGGEVCFDVLRPIGHVRPAIHCDEADLIREDAFWRLAFSEEYKELLSPFMPSLLSRNNLVLDVFGGLSLDYFDQDYDYFPTSSIHDGLRRIYLLETSDDDYDSPYSSPYSTPSPNGL